MDYLATLRSLGIAAVLMTSHSAIHAELAKNQYEYSHNITATIGAAENNAANFERSSSAKLVYSFPLMESPYVMSIGWQNMNQFDHSQYTDSYFKVDGVVFGISRNIYRGGRLIIAFGLQGFVYNSSLYFRENKKDEERDFTWGPELKARLQWRSIALAAGIEWYNDISNAQTSALMFGMSFKIGPTPKR